MTESKFINGFLTFMGYSSDNFDWFLRKSESPVLKSYDRLAALGFDENGCFYTNLIDFHYNPHSKAGVNEMKANVFEYLDKIGAPIEDIDIDDVELDDEGYLFFNDVNIADL